MFLTGNCHVTAFKSAIEALIIGRTYTRVGKLVIMISMVIDVTNELLEKMER